MKFDTLFWKCFGVMAIIILLDARLYFSGAFDDVWHIGTDPFIIAYLFWILCGPMFLFQFFFCNNIATCDGIFSSLFGTMLWTQYLDWSIILFASIFLWAGVFRACIIGARKLHHVSLKKIR